VSEDPARQAVPLKVDGALMNVVAAAAMQSEAVRVGIATFLEGRELKGSWRLRITGAQLVPVEPIHEGAATPD
jgi:hypothetical protein